MATLDIWTLKFEFLVNIKTAKWTHIELSERFAEVSCKVNVRNLNIAVKGFVIFELNRKKKKLNKVINLRKYI